MVGSASVVVLATWLEPRHEWLTVASRTPILLLPHPPAVRSNLELRLAYCFRSWANLQRESLSPVDCIRNASSLLLTKSTLIQMAY